MRQLRNSKECNDVLMAEELRKILLSLNCEYQGHGRNAISPESLFLVIWKVVPRFRCDLFSYIFAILIKLDNSIFCQFASSCYIPVECRL